MSETTPGAYDGPLESNVLPVGHCSLIFRFGTFDSNDDADLLPEQRIPKNATLTVVPNLDSPVMLPDGTVMVIRGTTFHSDTGEFDFWAIDGNRSNVNPSGWNWTATLKINGATQTTFTFSPDSTLPHALNIGTMIPFIEPESGIPYIRGETGPGIISVDSVEGDTYQLIFGLSDGTFLPPVSITSPDLVTQAAQDARDAAIDASNSAQDAWNQTVETADALKKLAAIVRIDSTRGVLFKSNQIATVLNVTIFRGDKVIEDVLDLQAEFGMGTHIEWQWQRMGENSFGTISSSDQRLSRGGFSLTVSPDDVDSKTVFRAVVNRSE